MALSQRAAAALALCVLLLAAAAPSFAEEVGQRARRRGARAVCGWSAAPAVWPASPALTCTRPPAAGCGCPQGRADGGEERAGARAGVQLPRCCTRCAACAAAELAARPDRCPAPLTGRPPPLPPPRPATARWPRRRRPPRPPRRRQRPARRRSPRLRSSTATQRTRRCVRYSHAAVRMQPPRPHAARAVRGALYHRVAAANAPGAHAVPC